MYALLHARAAHLTARWHLVLWLCVALVWLPIASFGLSWLSGALLAQPSLLRNLLGLLVAGLQGLAVLGAAAAISAGTTVRQLAMPPREVAARTVWVLAGSLWLLAAAAAAAPIAIWTAVALPFSPWDIPLWLALLAALSWAALVATSAGEVGPRRARRAVGRLLRTSAGRLLAGVVPAAAAALAGAAAITPLAGDPPLYSYLCGLAAVGCAARFSHAWDAARRSAAPQGRVLRPLAQPSGVREARRLLLGLLRGDVRI